MWHVEILEDIANRWGNRGPARKCACRLTPRPIGRVPSSTATKPPPRQALAPSLSLDNLARDVLHKLVTGSREQRGVDKVWVPNRLGEHHKLRCARGGDGVRDCPHSAKVPRP